VLTNGKRLNEAWRSTTYSLAARVRPPLARTQRGAAAGREKRHHPEALCDCFSKTRVYAKKLPALFLSRNCAVHTLRISVCASG